jgi:hypothetical protein
MRVALPRQHQRVAGIDHTTLQRTDTCALGPPPRLTDRADAYNTIGTSR